MNKSSVNQLSGYDVVTRCTLLYIVVGMMSVHFMLVFNYTIIDIITVGNANLYVVLV
jgi:hypothetical protein